MKIEYLAGMQPYVEHVAEPELSRWTAEHPQVVIVHATPEHEQDERTGDALPSEVSR
jgi:hypothetical protein